MEPSPGEKWVVSTSLIRDVLYSGSIYPSKKAPPPDEGLNHELVHPGQTRLLRQHHDERSYSQKKHQRETALKVGKPGREIFLLPRLKEESMVIRSMVDFWPQKGMVLMV
jgi:hypothetical protein